MRAVVALRGAGVGAAPELYPPDLALPAPRASAGDSAAQRRSLPADACTSSNDEHWHVPQLAPKDHCVHFVQVRASSPGRLAPAEAFEVWVVNRKLCRFCSVGGSGGEFSDPVRLGVNDTESTAATTVASQAFRFGAGTPDTQPPGVGGAIAHAQGRWTKPPALSRRASLRRATSCVAGFAHGGLSPPGKVATHAWQPSKSRGKWQTASSSTCSIGAPSLLPSRSMTSFGSQSTSRADIRRACIAALRGQRAQRLVTSEGLAELVAIARRLRMDLDLVRSLRASFCSFDTDKDGFLSRSDFIEMVKTTATYDGGREVTAESPEGLIDRWFARSGVDAAEGIDFETYLVWYQAHSFEELLLLPGPQRSVRLEAQRQGIDMHVAESIYKVWREAGLAYNSSMELDRFREVLPRLCGVRDGQVPESKTLQLWALACSSGDRGCIGFASFLLWCVNYFDAATFESDL